LHSEGKGRKFNFYHQEQLFHCLVLSCHGSQDRQGHHYRYEPHRDADLIEIGENCIIGGNSSIAAHYAAGARGRLRKVRIGNSVTIGANTAVMPGVVIENNVTVGANSLVALGMHLKSGGTYLGVPVERIK
jgi:NDP-sugar pyrophosphorylase family protein